MMTDEQIIKALECLESEKDVLCEGCAYKHHKGYTCHKANAKDALALIQRQKAEITALTDIVKECIKENLVVSEGKKKIVGRFIFKEGDDGQ